VGQKEWLADGTSTGVDIHSIV